MSFFQDKLQSGRDWLENYCHNGDFAQIFLDEEAVNIVQMELTKLVPT